MGLTGSRLEGYVSKKGDISLQQAQRYVSQAREVLHEDLAIFQPDAMAIGIPHATLEARGRRMIVYSGINVLALNRSGRAD